MRGRLILAAVVAVCALAGLIFLAKTATVPAMVSVEQMEEAAGFQTIPPETDAGAQPADPLRELLASMTLEEKVGQLFLARCPETDGAGEVSRLHLGGLLLFSRDFDGETPASMAQKVLSYQEAANIPLLIGVDEEGGTVTRVSNHRAFRAQPFSSPRQLYSQGGMELVLKTEAEKAQLLNSLGINVNLAPVCDISAPAAVPRLAPLPCQPHYL